MSTSEQDSVQSHADAPFMSPESQEPDTPSLIGAGFWIRGLARVIDLVVHYAVSIVAILFVGVLFGIVVAMIGAPATWITQKLASVSLANYVFAGVGYLAYHATCEGLHGATLGKRICRLVVIKEDGSPCDLGPAVRRTLAFFADGLVFGVVGAASISKSPVNQRVGDKVADTLVMKRHDLPAAQVRSGLRFAAVFLGAAALDGIIYAIPYLFSIFA